MFKRLVCTSLIFGMLATAPPVLAAGCSPRDHLVDRLQSSYAEHLRAGGLQTSQPTSTLIEFWASETTGTFTVLVSHPNGLSCVVASGTGFFQLMEQPRVTESPS
ncbi:hypothetical protein [Phaeobacter porticola]|uniref:Lipoprotein n=1 Tax=Phaeobacter porticola TaxID=1844006 RepID=A0A1L3I9F8_9RHOB|nr:hypothetical protein [Phaeobacter porticola]APG48758.1 hypothetical protein PhaeoP97_03405 [Phaeobacter porticola]